MKRTATPIAGVEVIDTTAHEDNRGAFARLYCARELRPLLGDRKIVQINHSLTRRAGAVRGLHYQNPPHSESKIVRCLSGRVFDVAVDLRQGSPTFLHWHACELTAANRRALVIPEGCAHGFQALEPDSELLYLHTAYYEPASEAGVRFDDPRIGIAWPCPALELSARDAALPFVADDFRGVPA